MALPQSPAHGCERGPQATTVAGPYTEASTRDLIRGDLAAWQAIWGRPAKWGMGRCTPLALCYALCIFAGLRATLLFRLSHALHRRRVPALPTLLYQLNLTLHGLDIPPHCRIGPGLYIPHPFGIVVDCVSIGARCSLTNGITIGMRGVHTFPTLGDDVYVGAGARVLGGVLIGNNVQIGANAVVLSDVPDSVSVVGVPARPVQPR